MPNQELWVSILVAVIGLAIVAVIFSARSQTASVIGAAGSAFSGILQVAVSPITGGTSPAPAPAVGGQSAFSGQGLTPVLTSVAPIIGAAQML